MSVEMYDELLVKALRNYKAKQLASVPENKDIDYEFSEGFKRKMERLIRNQEKSYYKLINTTAKKAAIIIVSIIIGLSATLTIDAIREPIFNFFYEIFSTHTEIKPLESQTSEKEDIKITHYIISDIPSDYEETETYIDELGLDIYWFNKDRTKSISFSQYKSIGYDSSVNSENGEIKELSINDIRTLVCNNKYNYICIWSEYGYNFELSYPLEFGEEYAYKVVGKLKVLNNTKSHD